MQTRSQTFRRYPRTHRPAGDGQGLSVEVQKFCGARGLLLSLVRGLLRSCGPSNIAGLIAPIVVYSINAVCLAGACANIGNEVCKSAPSLTNMNAAPAVIGEGFAFRIPAPLKHCTPNGILGRPGWPCLAMLTGSLRNSPSILASATDRRSGSKGVAACRDCSATIAATIPEAPALTVQAIKRNYDKFEKSLPSNIASAMPDSRLGLSHCVTPDTSCVGLEPRGVDRTVCGSLHSSRSGYLTREPFATNNTHTDKRMVF